MRWSGLIVCAAIGALVTFGFVGDAIAADAAHGARWFVEVSGDREAGCTTGVALQHEVVLACAAMGTCHVVDDPREAELRATLICRSGDAPWRLELHTVEGTHVSSTELAGARDDRLREAAMEIARDQAPERALAAESLRDTLGEGDKVMRPWKLPKMSLAIGAAGSAGGIDGTSGGGRALFGFQLARRANLTVGTTALMGGSGSESARHLRSGFGLAIGAPFDDSIIGVVVEGGLAVLNSYQTKTGVRTMHAETLLGGYGQGGVVLAIPQRFVRPYVAFMGGVYTEPRATVFATADAGVAFSLF